MKNEEGKTKMFEAITMCKRKLISSLFYILKLIDKKLIQTSQVFLFFFLFVINKTVLTFVFVCQLWAFEQHTYTRIVSNIWIKCWTDGVTYFSVK